MRLFIAGEGNFGREMESWLALCGTPTSGFMDDTHGDVKIDAWTPSEGDQVLVAISDPVGREDVVERLKRRGAAFHEFRAYLARSPWVTMGGGGIYCHGSIISRGAIIGDFVHVNLHSTVGHNVEIGDYCTLACHVDLMGHVKVGKRCSFGSGSRVLPGVKIGNDCRIGAGAVVVKDVPSGTTIYGPSGRAL